jgi:hypothetical protein
MLAYIQCGRDSQAASIYMLKIKNVRLELHVLRVQAWHRD